MVGRGGVGRGKHKKGNNSLGVGVWCKGGGGGKNSTGSLEI